MNKKIVFTWDGSQHAFDKIKRLLPKAKLKSSKTPTRSPFWECVKPVLTIEHDSKTVTLETGGELYVNADKSIVRLHREKQVQGLM